MKALLLNIRDDFFSVNALYFFAFSVIVSVLSFPLDFYGDFILEHRFGLSNQSLKDWFKDVFKKACVGFVVSLILVEAVYFFLSQFSRSWWIWAAVFWLFVSVVVTRIYPKVILPLFYHPKPLEGGELRNRIFALLEKCKIPLKEVYVLDFSKKTVKANAMVTGLGATKQIYLSDTLLAEFPANEIETVLAHEVGHYVSRDTLKLSIMSFCSALISFFFIGIILDRLTIYFGFSAISDIAGLPLLSGILILASLSLAPLQNGYSRFLEDRADVFALKTTQDTGGFISAMERLGKKNFSDFSPSKFVEVFLYTHPPLSKRIARAKGFSSLKGAR